MSEDRQLLARPCPNCGGRVYAPARAHILKRFCSDTCRAAYREQRIGKALAAMDTGLIDLAEGMDQTILELQRLQASIEALQAHLRQSQAGKKKGA